KPIRGWDSRNHTIRHVYDALLRPIDLFVQTGNDAEHRVEHIEYGERLHDDQALNLRTRVYQQFDGAGLAWNERFDFKGNVLTSGRNLLRDYKEEVDLPEWLVDWAGGIDTYFTSTIYDALNRPIAISTSAGPHIIRPAYNEANLLERLSGDLGGWLTAFVTNIDYNAKGQRELIEYGNNARTTYKYDPETFRLIRLKTTRKSDNAVLHALTYTYDPAGNITKIADAAQQTIYFNTQVVTSDAEYTYDAIYRLVGATGREHIGQASQPQTSWNDEFRVNLQHPQDG